jgi:hypothetical protein
MKTQNENTVTDEDRLDDDPLRLAFPFLTLFITVDTSLVPPNQC